MKKDIEISAIDLATEILNNKKWIGNSNWAIYVNLDGDVDCRSNVHPNSEWYKLVDLYSFWDDENTLNSSVEELADWLQSDGICYFDDIETDETVEDEDGVEFLVLSISYAK
jgi:hypothetical protein